MAEFQTFHQKVEDASHHSFPSSSMSYSGGRQLQHAQSHEATMVQTTFSQVHANSNTSTIGARNVDNMQNGLNPHFGGHGHPTIGGGIQDILRLNEPNRQFMDSQSRVQMLVDDGAPGKRGHETAAGGFRCEPNRAGNNVNNPFPTFPGHLHAQSGSNNNHDHQSATNLYSLGQSQNIHGNNSTNGGRVYGAVTTSKGSSVLPSETVGVGNLRHPQLNIYLNSPPPPGAAAISGMNSPTKSTINSCTTLGVPASSGSSGSLGSDDQEIGSGLRSARGQINNNQKDEYDDGEGEVLAAGSYQLVELYDHEILAEHTHFCDLCGKGFKRDANLRMHMRSHGDEYKTPEALARPIKPIHEQTPEIPKRFSCPHIGCKRNVKHRKFQPLKSLLCVKNHYRRSHCAKNLVCMLVWDHFLQKRQAVWTRRSTTYEENPFAVKIRINWSQALDSLWTRIVVI
ncbi:hypothetical protein R1flu_026265 [Riccia fluitans]|uniref:C2H2-type domain-containing protein n=1 Tax=Riccia fluitans TaxID=41844 RepID=A0ABD1XFG8_9MARC